MSRILLIEDDTTARSEHYLPARMDRGDAAGRIVDAVAIGRDGKVFRKIQGRRSIDEFMAMLEPALAPTVPR